METTDTAHDLARLLGEEPYVRRLARALLFDEHEVDDVVQETWLKALRYRPAVGGGVKPWLKTVVRGLALNARRGHARRRDHELRAAASPGTSSELSELLAREEARREMVLALQRLREPYRETLLLRHLEGLPPRRIAERLDLPRATIATRLKRGHALLREAMDARHGGDRRAWCAAILPLARREALLGGILSAPSWSTAGGLLVMKSICLVLCVVALVGGALWFLRSPEGEVTPAKPLWSAVVEGRGAPGASADTALDTRPFRAEAERPLHPGPAERHPDSWTAGLAGLTGRVLGVDGRPVPGTSVRLLGLDPHESFGSILDLSGGAGRAGVRTSETRTDAAGRFLFEEILPGTWHALFAGADGEDPTLHLLQSTPAPGRLTDLGDIQLEDKGSVVGRLIDEEGEPLVGATLTATDLPPEFFVAAPIERLRGDGALLVALPEPEKIEGFLGHEAAFHAAMRKQLGRTLVTAGPDHEWMLLDLPAWARDLIDRLPVPRTRTDAEGRFVLHGLEPGRNAVLVRAEGHASVVRRVTSRSGAHENLGDWTVRAGKVLEGVVRDAQGAPVAGAELRVAVRPGIGMTGILIAGPVRRADEAGRFHVPGLPRARVVVAARSAPGEPWCVTGPVGLRAPVDVRLPARQDVVLHVRSTSDAPLEAAPEISLRPGVPLSELTAGGLVPELELEERLEREGPVAAGAQALRFRDLPEGRYTAVLHAPGHVVTMHSFRVPEDVGEPLEVGLEPAPALRLRVVDEEGTPVPDVQVLGQAEPVPAWARTLLYSYGGRSGFDQVMLRLGLTDARGELLAHVLPVGPALVAARHPALGLVMAPIELPLESEDVLTLELARPARLHGRFTVGGLPPEPGRFVLKAEPEFGVPYARGPGITRQTRPDADGRYAFEGLEPGRWRIVPEPVGRLGSASLSELLASAHTFSWTFADGSRPLVRLDPAEDQRLDFDHEKGMGSPEQLATPVRVRVTLDGRPYAEGRVWTTGHPQTVDRPLDAAGEAELGALPPQLIHIGVSDPESGAVLHDEEVEVSDDGPQLVRIDLESARIQGVVTTADGRPVPDALVRWKEPGSGIRGASAMARTGPRGRFELRVTRPEGRLRVSDVAGACERKVAVPLGGEERIALELARAGCVRGRVLPSPEGPAARQILFRSSDGTGHYVASIGEDGRFSYDFLPPDDYLVFLQAPSDPHLPTEPGRVEVREEGAFDLEIRPSGR